MKSIDPSSGLAAGTLGAVLSRFPSGPTLCHPMDHGPPSCSVHGILQAGILEWVAISFSSTLGGG